MTRKSRRCWSKSIGEPGHRVRLYEARPGGSIMRSVFTNGKEDRKSLVPRGRHRVRRGDLQRVADATDRPYDPSADAQDIARLRRKL